MDLKTAKLVLTRMELSEFTERCLLKSGGYEERFLNAPILDPSIMDGAFTADELEAIATWMRDPSGVVNAE